MSLNDIHEKYLWFINGNRIAIVEKNEAANSHIDKLKSVSTSGLQIRIEYLTRPLPFTEDLTASSEIPDQFHEALSYKVISDLCKLPGERQNLQLAQYFDQQYMLAVREGKKYASRRRISGGTITPVDF
tara:strand:- start:204 stop:590 length:387 start_codon:yes stop_codon:yes gene_type:complete